MRKNVNNDVSKDSPIQPMFMSFVAISSSSLLSLFKGHITNVTVLPQYGLIVPVFFFSGQRGALQDLSTLEVVPKRQEKIPKKRFRCNGVC